MLPEIGAEMVLGCTFQGQKVVFKLSGVGSLSLLWLLYWEVDLVDLQDF